MTHFNISLHSTPVLQVSSYIHIQSLTSNPTQSTEFGCNSKMLSNKTHLQNKGFLERGPHVLAVSLFKITFFLFICRLGNNMEFSW